MERLSIMALVMALVGVLALPPLATADSSNSNADNNRDKIIAKAQPIREKREQMRIKVDKEMKDRLKLIRQNQQGNLGPVGN